MPAKLQLERGATSERSAVSGESVLWRAAKSRAPQAYSCRHCKSFPARDRRAAKGKWETRTLTCNLIFHLLLLFFTTSGTFTNKKSQLNTVLAEEREEEIPQLSLSWTIPLGHLQLPHYTTSQRLEPQQAASPRSNTIAAKGGHGSSNWFWNIGYFLGCNSSWFFQTDTHTSLADHHRPLLRPVSPLQGPH